MALSLASEIHECVTLIESLEGPPVTVGEESNNEKQGKEEKEGRDLKPVLDESNLTADQKAKAEAKRKQKAEKAAQKNAAKEAKKGENSGKAVTVILGEGSASIRQRVLTQSVKDRAVSTNAGTGSGSGSGTGVGSYEAEQQRAGKGERHGAEQDDERIAEALELRGQHEENEHHGKQQRRAQLVALDAELPRLAGVIDRVAFRQDFRGFGFEHLERLIERDAGRNRTLDFCGVQLLEAVQRARLARFFHAREGGQLHEFAAGAGDVKILELFGIQPLGAPDLRDDFVAAALDAEAVYKIAAEHGAEISADLLQVHS